MDYVWHHSNTYKCLIWDLFERHGKQEQIKSKLSLSIYVKLEKKNEKYVENNIDKWLGAQGKEKAHAYIVVSFYDNRVSILFYLLLGPEQ